jgi:trehalose 6-phosphate phosphatase
MPLPPPPADIDASETAFFLDFDGTLVEFAERPDAVALGDEMRRTLSSLVAASGGAVAVVSGRELGVIDAMLHPLRLPASGEHGLERRSADGEVTRAVVGADAAAGLHREVARFASPHDGLLVEAKGGSVALHYRRRPDLEPACLAFADGLEGRDGIHPLRGKMVVEFKLSTRTKADALADFMREAPFHGRRPLYAGDDVTDEDALRWVAGRQGVAIKIGPGETAAGYRLAGVDALRQWLAGLLPDQMLAPGGRSGTETSGGG